MVGTLPLPLPSVANGTGTLNYVTHAAIRHATVMEYRIHRLLFTQWTAYLRINVGMPTSVWVRLFTVTTHRNNVRVTKWNAV